MLMKKHFLYLALFILLFPLIHLSAQEEPVVDTDLIEDLKLIDHGRTIISKEIEDKEALLKEEAEGERKQKLQKELSRLRYKLALLEDNLDNTVADVDIFADDEESDSDRDLGQEMQDVLSPIVKTLKRMSARPRLVEKYRDQLGLIEQKLVQVELGLNNITSLEKEPQTQAIKDIVEASKSRISDFKIELLSEKKNIQKRLDEELKSSGSFWQASGDLFHDFFSNKGKNLLVSLAVALIIFALMFLVKIKILKPILRFERLTAVSKPIMAFYGVFAAIISVISALLCLFLLNDWLLFTLAVLVIGAIFWAFKHLIVNFIGALRVILDMGTVREGERIMYEGCAWRVRKVGLRTHLVNEALEGGSLYVHIGQIKDHVSRPIVKDEPWFPTHKGDYALLSDGTYGMVLVQTPDQVVLLLEDLAKRFYSLSDFIELRPTNLSSGFVVTAYIAMDYEHQKKIFDIVELFKRELKQKFPKNNLIVDLAEAGADSLNIVAKVSYDGSRAKDYMALNRDLNAHIVDVCNKNKLIIPFKQLTVHVEK